MARRLDGKLALITGGSRGIGRAMASAMAAEGARVVIASRKQDALDAVAAELNEVHPDSVVARACHTGQVAGIGPFFEALRSDVGTPDIVVNNAATNPYFGPLMDLEWGAWDKTFDVNLKGYFEVARQAALGLMAADRSGSIINISSVYGLQGAPMQGIYGMTKAAVVSLTKTLAVELGGAGIRVNAVAPGLVETRFAAAIVHTPALREHFTARAPLGRHAQPDELAGIAVYLGSDESSFVTGQTFVVDGGYLSG